MRTIGFVLVLLGIVTIYLAVKGKMGAAFTALLTGQTGQDNGTQDTTANNTTVKLPGTTIKSPTRTQSGFIKWGGR